MEEDLTGAFGLNVEGYIAKEVGDTGVYTLVCGNALDSKSIQIRSLCVQKSPHCVVFTCR